MSATPPETLEKAVSAGVITGAQAEALRQLSEREGVAATDAAASDHSDAPQKGKDEPFVLVNNFGDIFLCLGLVILYSSANMLSFADGIASLLFCYAFAALFWILTEIFVFQSRRKFPAVLSAFMFIWLAFQSYNLAFGERVSLSGLVTGALTGQGAPSALFIMNALFIFTLMRYRLPILALGFALSFALLIFSIAMQYIAPLNAFTVLALCGVALIAAGIFLDTKDRTRTGHYHEFALWLFFVGSPLLVHGVMVFVLQDHFSIFWSGSLSENPGLSAAPLGEVIWTVSALTFAFTILGLILDRRALVSSSLLYISVVLTYIIYQTGIDFAAFYIIVPFSIGLLVIVLGLRWDPLRDRVLRILPFARWFRPPSKV